jgi:hypothetical protein
METIKFGGPGEIAPVLVKVPSDAWENTIRAFGVVNACEWFGHAADSEFTDETIWVLRMRSDLDVAA